VDLLRTNPVRDFTLIQLKRTDFGPYAPFPFVLFPLNDISRLEDGGDWKRVTQMLGHEIGHFWFGALLRSDPTEQWLSEGFAQYLSYLVIERLYGRDALDKELENCVSKLSEIETTRQAPLCKMPLDHPAQFTLVRAKGAIVLHCLRQECTEDLFRAFLKQLVATYQGKRIDTATVENLCSVTETLRDAQEFFDIHLCSMAKYQWDDGARRIVVVS
jgi:aminopeptidase N